MSAMLMNEFFVNGPRMNISKPHTQLRLVKGRDFLEEKLGANWDSVSWIE